ncbi:hypothetical protein ERJ75_001215600 [Trypanosoma vivax]|nr:hypothetical protein ERJ75_001215600 [Trypanosoma vivax]
MCARTSKTQGVEERRCGERSASVKKPRFCDRVQRCALALRAARKPQTLFRGIGRQNRRAARAEMSRKDGHGRRAGNVAPNQEMCAKERGPKTHDRHAVKCAAMFTRTRKRTPPRSSSKSRHSGAAPCCHGRALRISACTRNTATTNLTETDSQNLQRNFNTNLTNEKSTR